MACAVLVACSESSAAGSDSDAGFDAGIEATPGCAGETLAPGDHVVGEPRTRQYIVHVPRHEPGTAMPLVLNMHGFLMNAPLQQTASRMDEVADELGYVVVYPSGTDTLTSFNAGDCCAFADPERDDMGYLEGVIDEVGEALCIDSTRVYASGFSNGGFMAYRFACERPDRFAAIGSVSGVLGIAPEQCTAPYALPALHLHGTADVIVPYQGGEPLGFALFFPNAEPPQFRSVAATVEAYRELSGCENKIEKTFDEADTLCTRYAQCDAGSEITLCTIQDGGHTWPGGDGAALSAAFSTLGPALGRTSTTLNASRELLEFFGKHRRR